MTVSVRKATSREDLDAAKSLFFEYADWLGVDLCFQGFDEEMAKFPATYSAVYVALEGDTIIGTIALKHHTNERCEMKRLYVKPGAQKAGAGLALCNALIHEARTVGYKEMVLDTLKRLESALSLYQKIGFQEITAYTPNPEADVVYMALKL